MENIKIEKLTPKIKKKIYKWDDYKLSFPENYKKLKDHLCSFGVKAFLDYRNYKKSRKLYQRKNEEFEEYFYVLKKDEEYVGVLQFELAENWHNNGKTQMEISRIGISPAFQGKGYGYLFIKEVLNNPLKYMTAKPDEVYAEIFKTNVESKKLFEKLGFNIGEYAGDKSYYEAALFTNSKKIEKNREII